MFYNMFSNNLPGFVESVRAISPKIKSIADGDKQQLIRSFFCGRFEKRPYWRLKPIET